VKSGLSEPATIAVGLFSFQFGGSERIGINLAIEFRARGYRVVCFAFHDSDGPMCAELERAGVRCLDLNYSKVRGLLRWPRYQWRMWRMLRHERVAALHVHHHGALILCGIPARCGRVPRVVMTEHGLQALQERANARRLTRRYSRYATDITVVEPNQAEYFRTVLGIPAGKVHCIPNGVRVPSRSIEAVRSARKMLAIGPGEFAFFYVGRLNPVKDLGTLLQAFATLPSPLREQSRLFLVGDGAERASLETKRDVLGLGDRIRFLGARNDVADVLMAADAFVMSSKSEGLPMVLLEAMAAGVPCVATAVGGIPKLFGTDCGMLVPAGDAPALAGAMAALAASQALRERLAANALGNLRLHYALDRVVDQYLQLFGLPLQVS
jgi:glycosyltransferase involved in cell wall biosynthesis